MPPPPPVDAPISFRRLAFPDLYAIAGVDRDINADELATLQGSPEVMAAADLLSHPYAREHYDQVLGGRPSVQDRAAFDRVAQLRHRHRAHQLTPYTTAMVQHHELQMEAAATLLEYSSTIDMDALASLVYHLQSPPSSHADLDAKTSYFTSVIFTRPIEKPDGFAFHAVQSLWEDEPTAKWAFGTNTYSDVVPDASDGRLPAAQYLYRVGALCVLAQRYVDYGELPAADPGLGDRLETMRPPASLVLEAGFALTQVERATRRFSQEDSSPDARLWSEAWMSVVYSATEKTKSAPPSFRTRARDWARSSYPSTTPVAPNAPTTQFVQSSTKRLDRLATTTMDNAVAARIAFWDAVEVAPLVPPAEIVRLADLLVETHDRAELALVNRRFHAERQAGDLQTGELG